MTDQPKKQPDLVAYAVRESNGKSYFTRIGVAFANAKGGHNIHLDANPIDGKLVLLPPPERDEPD